MSNFVRTRQLITLGSCLLLATLAHAQSSTTLTETVAKRSTIGVLTATPNTGLVTGTTTTFSYILHTAGAPAPTSETVQFLDGATPFGSAATIGSLAAANLLPYAQVDSANGWTTAGTAPTSVTINTGTGPDGSTSSATQVVYPSTSGSSSAVFKAVPGTAYANLPLTLSVWAKAASASTLTLTLADSPASTATQSNTCAVTTTWQRCTLTYTFPSNAGTGFSVALASANLGAQTISLWGVQVEQASSAGPFVSSIGTARPTGGQGGTVTFAYSLFDPGTHPVTVSYTGDANFNASTSNIVSLTVAQATQPVTLVASPVSPSVYGTSITLTASIAAPATNPTATPTGTVQFFRGATSLGTVTLSSGSAALTLVGLTSLPAGTNSLTAVYSGDSRYTTATSSALSYVITKSSAVTVTATSSRNPSTYGDRVTFSLTAAASGAIPTGTIAVLDGATNIGTITLDGTGAGTLAIPLFTAGTHSLTFTYSGDANYN